MVCSLSWRRVPARALPFLYPSMDAHPLDRLRRAGVRVSVNTDDPSLLGTNLPREYEIATKSYGWSEAVLRDVACTSIEASFARPDVKEELRGDLSAWGTGSENFRRSAPLIGRFT